MYHERGSCIFTYHRPIVLLCRIASYCILKGVRRVYRTNAAAQKVYNMPKAARGGGGSGNGGGKRPAESSDSSNNNKKKKKKGKSGTQTTLFGVGVEKIDKAPLLCSQSLLLSDNIYES